MKADTKQGSPLYRYMMKNCPLCVSSTKGICGNPYMPSDREKIDLCLKAAILEALNKPQPNPLSELSSLLEKLPTLEADSPADVIAQATAAIGEATLNQAAEKELNQQ